MDVHASLIFNMEACGSRVKNFKTIFWAKRATIAQQLIMRNFHKDVLIHVVPTGITNFFNMRATSGLHRLAKHSEPTSFMTTFPKCSNQTGKTIVTAGLYGWCLALEIPEYSNCSYIDRVHARTLFHDKRIWSYSLIHFTTEKKSIIIIKIIVVGL